jgi:hypothetical protein
MESIVPIKLTFNQANCLGYVSLFFEEETGFRLVPVQNEGKPDTIEPESIELTANHWFYMCNITYTLYNASKRKVCVKNELDSMIIDEEKDVVTSHASGRVFGVVSMQIDEEKVTKTSNGSGNYGSYATHSFTVKEDEPCRCNKEKCNHTLEGLASALNAITEVTVERLSSSEFKFTNAHPDKVIFILNFAHDNWGVVLYVAYPSALN